MDKWLRVPDEFIKSNNQHWKIAKSFPKFDKILVILGKNGCGKTTLWFSLMRRYALDRFEEQVKKGPDYNYREINDRVGALQNQCRDRIKWITATSLARKIGEKDIYSNEHPVYPYFTTPLLFIDDIFRAGLSLWHKEALEYFVSERFFLGRKMVMTCSLGKKDFGASMSDSGLADRSKDIAYCELEEGSYRGRYFQNINPEDIF